MNRVPEAKWTAAAVAALIMLAAIPAPANLATVAYQGIVRGPGGAALANGAYDMVFSIWDAETGGVKRWGDETHTGVSVTDGFFSVQLGETNPLGSVFAVYSALWLEVSIAGEVYGPRVPLSSVPYARHAQDGTPPGGIISYGGNTAPAGWLLCDGAAVSRTTYSALFAAIGTVYGAGDGSTTFNLPDLRGIGLVGAGTTTRASGRDAANNAYSATLGSYYQDQMQGHHHTNTHNHTQDAHTHGFTSTNVGWPITSSAPPAVGHDWASWGGGPFYVTQPAITATQATNQAYTGNTGSPANDSVNGAPRTGTLTRGPAVGVNFIIKY